MRAGAFAVGVACVCAALLGSTPAAAGPWTLPKGALQAFVSFEGRRAPARFDAVGQPTSGRRYSGTASVAVERGFTDWLTLGLKSESRGVQLETDGVNGGQFGEAERAVWGRVRLMERDGYVGAAQLGYSMPGLEEGVTSQMATRFDSLDIHDGAAEIDGRLLFGKGWSSGPAVGWLAAEAGYRLRNHKARDQLRLDLTAGARPRAAPRFLAMGQVFATKSVGAGDRGDYDLLKLSASVGFEVTEEVTVVFGGVREVAGRNVERGESVTLSLWLRY